MPHFSILLGFIFLLLSHTVQSQNPVLILEGIVHGIEQAPSTGFLKKNPPTFLQGTLENVKISLYLKDQLVKKIDTDEKGVYQLSLEFDELYTIVISRNGYNKNTLILDTRAFPSTIKKGGFLFSGAEFVLNSYEKGTDPSLNRNIGRLYFSPSKKIFILEYFKENESGGIFNNSTKKNPSAELLEKAVAKNNEKLKGYKPLPKPVQPKNENHPMAAEAEINVSSKTEPLSTNAPVERLTIPRDFNLSYLSKGSDEELITIQEDAIRREKEQLTIYKLLIKTKEDSLEIIRRENQIALAEQHIHDAKALISTQKKNIKAQQDKMYLLITLLIVLSCSSFLAFSYFRQRQKVSQLIESKNRQITDSINYARRIQQSILISEDILQQYFPESFVFLQPKAIVSGDFYFIAPIGKKFLVAVADCTGHGVPGAFMSLIGYRLLREIVVEKEIHDPASVLSYLHEGINESLKQSEDKENSQDGMDIAICLVDPENHTLVFAGAMNPAYLIYNQELNVLQADVSSVGGKTLRLRNEHEKKKFSNKACQYSPGCMLYLFTDGYMDQFGGEQDKKFNTKRFKQMLMDIQPLSASDQKEIISTTLREWKKDTAQTDDILMLGIRLY